jgi:hypothetical protein
MEKIWHRRLCALTDEMSLLRASLRSDFKISSSLLKLEFSTTGHDFGILAGMGCCQYTRNTVGDPAAAKTVLSSPKLPKEEISNLTRDQLLTAIFVFGVCCGSRFRITAASSW